MASGTMREPVVSSPQPAITLQSGSPIDESPNSSCYDNKSERESNSSREDSGCGAINTSNEDSKNVDNFYQKRSGDEKAFDCGTCRTPFSSTRESDRQIGKLSSKEPFQKHSENFKRKGEERDNGDEVEKEEEEDDCSNHSEDCETSNNRIESNISTNLSSQTSSESKSESFESDDSFRVIKSLRSARRQERKDEECKKKSNSDSELAASTNRRKVKTLNNNNNNNNNLYSDTQFRCPVCERGFNSWNVLQLHLENSHPDYEIKCEWCNLTFDSPRVLNLHRFMAHNMPEEGKKSETRKKLGFDSTKCKTDRKNLKNLPKVIGFQDINFVDFSSEKFPLIAKNICEKSLHLSKDDFSFDCSHCGRGFPCDTALEIHVQTCESNEKKNSPKIEKKNKRKSTPKFHPQQSAGSDSDDCLENMEINVSERQRKAFFDSLDLRNTEKSSTTSEEDAEKKSGKLDQKTDLADIQSILSVTNIPRINVKDFSSLQETKGKPSGDEKSIGNLNVHINNCRSSPESYSSLSLNSPNFNVLNLISPNYSGNDLTEEEAQDCFAAECRRMKLRGEFPCKLCTAIFPNLRALKGHNRVHISVANGTPNSPYRCNICTYNSLDKATLVRHMRSHNGDRPYECAMCNYAFTTKANCERHLRNRHSKITRDEVKSSIIYHPSEDPINDSDYQKTTEMNKRNLEKSKEKQELTLPVNLKINLSNLKETSKGEDLFQAEHQELIKNIKNEEEHKKTETGTMTEDFETDGYNDWQYDDNEEALDLRVCKGKNYESDSSDLPQDLSNKEEVKEFNNNIKEKVAKPISDGYLNQHYDGKSGLDINNLVKMYSAMYPSLNVTQIHQIILTQLNFPGILQKLHNFPFSSFLMSSPLFSSTNNYMQKNIQKDVVGLQMSGGNILDDKNHSLTMSEKLQFFQQQALAEIIFKREKDRIASEYFNKNPTHPGEDLEKHKRTNDFIKQNDYFIEPDKKSFGDILLSRREEKKEGSKISGNDKPTDNRNSSVKMVIKNGVLIPKQKQRRYRTERPFSCEHCSARFTLRSNMERHIKQQHPQYWTQKSRSNVGNVKKSEPNPIKFNSYDREFEITPNTDYLKHYEVGKPVSLVSRDNLNTSGGEIKWETSPRYKQEYDHDKDEVINLAKEIPREENLPNVKKEEIKSENDDDAVTREAAAIAEEEDDVDDEETKDELIINEEKVENVKKNQTSENSQFGISINTSKYIKIKQTPEKSETEIYKNEMKEAVKESQPQDLASVSRMLDNAVTQTQAFQKYFQYGSKKEDDLKREKEEAKRDEGDRSEEEEGLVAGSTSSDENRSESEASSRSGKKKSAYSLAPNRVSCPYCFRKFPWTSSLRRHVLTHTGQKPFKCTHCPLLFTTKSNCDRHLLRKHGREALIASSGQTENPETTGNTNLISTPSQSQNSNYPMRNVPERPYKCNQCPSSTFSTLSNLNKHLFSKHNSQHRSDSFDQLPITGEGKYKNMNPQAPPNITISPTFALGLPRTLSIIPQCGETLKMAGKSPVSSKTSTTFSPTQRSNETSNCNGLDKERPSDNCRAFRKRSSSEEMEATEKKRTSPDVKVINHESHDSDSHRTELLPIPPSELPFKCHLCDSSFGERSDALEHIRCQHPNEFQLLVSKGALETNTDEEKHQHDDADEILDSNRGRFPDYANRKVMCAFCMRRFWSAEDLRRHMRTHTGERPFSCDVCQRRFTLKHSMLRHRKKHSAHDEILVGSDEEHHSSYQVNHNNNISIAVSALQKPPEPEEGLHKTILHQTLTRCDDGKDDLKTELRIPERANDTGAAK